MKAVADSINCSIESGRAPLPIGINVFQVVFCIEIESHYSHQMNHRYRQETV